MIPPETNSAALSPSTRSDSLALDSWPAFALICLVAIAPLLVVGLPLNMDGSSGPAARGAITEAKRLATVVGVPVETFDERRTTVSADAALMEQKMNAQARRRVIDKVAAAVMLQTWLDARGARRWDG